MHGSSLSRQVPFQPNQNEKVWCVTNQQAIMVQNVQLICQVLHEVIYDSIASFKSGVMFCSWKMQDQKKYRLQEFRSFGITGPQENW